MALTPIDEIDLRTCDVISITCLEQQAACWRAFVALYELGQRPSPLEVTSYVERASRAPIPEVEVLFYGCWASIGHHLVRPNGTSAHDMDRQIPWSRRELLCHQHRFDHTDRIPYDTPQPEGQAMLRHKTGWTALAFWDRSVDDRKNCSSVYFAKGTYDSQRMIAMCKSAYPNIWARYKFDVSVVEVSR